MSKVLNIVQERGKTAFEDAIRDTQYGDSIVYYVGEYAGGTHRASAMQASNEGYVNLVQRKLSTKLFEYIAQRRKKKLKKKKTV
tara:strand:- start:9163 stop:9414 length:252 start_codon:yes stop_codon:yes gene_type:complete